VLVLDETFVTPDTSHQTLETRSAMAYWQDGRVFLYGGTQSTAQKRTRAGSLALVSFARTGSRTSARWCS